MNVTLHTGLVISPEDKKLAEFLHDMVKLTSDFPWDGSATGIFSLPGRDNIMLFSLEFKGDLKAAVLRDEPRKIVIYDPAYLEPMISLAREFNGGSLPKGSIKEYTITC
jgi:hypothetical protein